jgi:hypothetical protein
VSEECIPRREVTFRCNDKIWFDSNIQREIGKRDRFRRKYLKLKTALSQTIFKQQRNRVNNLKKQLKEKLYTNINENLNELKTINSKTYWKTINTLLKGESTKLNQTWQGWSLGGSLSKLCPTAPPSIQDGCHY